MPFRIAQEYRRSRFHQSWQSAMANMLRYTSADFMQPDTTTVPSLHIPQNPLIPCARCIVPAWAGLVLLTQFHASPFLYFHSIFLFSFLCCFFSSFFPVQFSHSINAQATLLFAEKKLPLSTKRNAEKA